MFAECGQGEPQFLCPDMAPGEDSPDGRPGCCSDGDLTFQFNCMGSQNETVDFYVRLDQAPENACVDDSVTYGFGPLN